MENICPIPPVPPEILDAAHGGRLVVFVGAGVSRIIGCPSWEEFALKQLEHLRREKTIDYYEYSRLRLIEPRKLLSICKNILAKKNLPMPGLREELQANANLCKQHKIYENLYKFNSIYVTTNYDDNLDKVVKSKMQITAISGDTSDDTPKKSDESQRKIIYDKHDFLVSNLKNGTIIHLHGSIEHESTMVVTIVDYMKHYERDAEPADLLKWIFREHTVLFVGYGLEEYEVLEFMISKSCLTKKILQHCMLYPVFKEERKLLKFHEEYYADLGVKLVPYPIGENGYEQLAAVIEVWANQIGPIARPQGFYERLKLIDEVK